MKRYKIKSAPGQRAHLEINGDFPDGLHVTITRHFDGYQTSEEDVMPRELFDVCVRTGYLTEIPRHEAGEVISVGVAS